MLPERTVTRELSYRQPRWFRSRQQISIVCAHWTSAHTTLARDPAVRPAMPPRGLHDLRGVLVKPHNYDTGHKSNKGLMPGVTPGILWLMLEGILRGVVSRAYKVVA